jgi:hypothetical protein
MTLVEYRQEEGWKKPLPLYRFRCEKHGLVESYPQGYMMRLVCPKCLEEQSSSKYTKR